jgi:hypothetical protein
MIYLELYSEWDFNLTEAAGSRAVFSAWFGRALLFDG